MLKPRADESRSASARSFDCAGGCARAVGVSALRIKETEHAAHHAGADRDGGSSHRDAPGSARTGVCGLVIGIPVEPPLIVKNSGRQPSLAPAFP